MVACDVLCGGMWMYHVIAYMYYVGHTFGHICGVTVIVCGCTVALCSARTLGIC